VLAWHRLALQALQALGTPANSVSASASGQPTAARALAILHTCMYNAWAAYDDDARQTVHGVAVRLPHAERSAASKASAMSHAAYLILGALFPFQKAVFDACMADLGLDPARPPGQFSPAGIGLTQAIGMLDASRKDGALPFAPAAPGQALMPAGAGAEAQALRWYRLAHDVSARDAYDDNRDVLLYFVLSNALADAELAGADAGTAAAEVLRSFTGSDRSGVVVGWDGADSFSAIAAQDGLAHTREGLSAGRQVGAQVFDKARRYWQGKL
jgi:hypothetical protein